MLDAIDHSQAAEQAYELRPEWPVLRYSLSFDQFPEAFIDEDFEPVDGEPYGVF